MDRNQTTLRNVRSMPQWVNENHSRIGPKPPPPPPTKNIPPPMPRKIAPDPDYEVIEFGQQYSNPGLPSKTLETEIKKPGIKCELCGSLKPTIKCEQCQQHLFCSSCDDMYHRHPKRQTHSRKFIDKNFKPPLPPKGEGNPAPQPPPRRNKNKLMGNFLQSSPSSSNGNHMTNGPKDGQVQPPHLIRPQPPPSPTLSLREKMGTLKRMINPGNRPLPPTPDQKPSSRPPSRPQTPNSVTSPFDTIRRAPSLTMEKIQNQTTATLDRMTQLQQRYKQHQEAMRADSDRSRRTSMASDIDMDMRIDQMRNRQQTIPVTRTISSSVQNLNQLNYRPPPQQGIGPGGGWSTTPMQQAQSMAHLNAPPPGLNPWQQPHQQMWNNVEPQMNGGSNMSLNMPPQGYFYPPENRPPPPVWMNTWGPTPMYPYPVGMVPMSPMLGHRSQVPSRTHSRAASPALSLRSRRSMMSNRKSHRNAYPKDLTDDEDSDLSDRELSPRSNRETRSRRESFSHKEAMTRRPRKTSSSGFDFDNEHEPELVEPKFHKKSQIHQRRSPVHKIVTPSPPPPPKIAAPIPMKAKVVAETQSAFQPVKKTIAPQTNVWEASKPSSSEEEDEEEEGDEEVENDIDEKELVDIIRDTRIETPDKNPSAAAPIANLDDDDDELGPPPEAPDHEWECEFCTYVNEANTKICLVCCKTPTQVPTKPKAVAVSKQKLKSPSPKPPPVTPVTIKSPLKQTATSKIIKKNDTKKSPKKVETATETEKPQTAGAIETSTSTRKTTSEESSSDAGKMKEPSPKTPHWIDLLELDSDKPTDEATSAQTQDCDEEIVVEEDKPSKVSTGCGPSPPKEILSTRVKKLSKSPTPLKDVPTKSEAAAAVKKMSVSTGTSPPPQTISTQTYDSPQTQPLTRDRSSHSIRRSHSMVTQNLPMHMHNDYHMHRSFSRQSFSSDTQSLPMTPPEDVVSPPYGSKHRNQQLLDDEAIAYINRTLNSQRKASEGRFRSQHDLRRSDSSRTRKMSLGDFHQAHRSRHSQQRQLLDENNITLDDIIALKRQEGVAPSGVELIKLLHEADQYNFSAEDLQAAFTHCGQSNPVTWLRENWKKLIETVQTLATKYGQERPENTIGTISVIEAREALRLHKGNVWHAVTECIEQRSKKFQEITSRGHYSREDIVTSLTAHHGNVEMALVELGKTQLKPFLMKIWGPPSGAENESGNILYNMEQMHGNGYYDEFHTQKEPMLKQQSNNINGAYSSLSSSSIVSDKKFDDNQGNPYYNNSNILRDIEALIGNMEQNQANQNENMMKNIENLLGNILQQHTSKSPSPFQSKLETANSYERLNTKSPIVIPKSQASVERTIVENDIREFMTQHIQDVSPDVVEHVQQEIQHQDNGFGSIIMNSMHTSPSPNNDLTDHELEIINKAINEAEQVSLETNNNSNNGAVASSPTPTHIVENNNLTDHELEMINKAINEADQANLQPENTNSVEVASINNAHEMQSTPAANNTLTDHELEMINKAINEADQATSNSEAVVETPAIENNSLTVNELEMVNRAISEADGVLDLVNNVDVSLDSNLENNVTIEPLMESSLPETVVESVVLEPVAQPTLPTKYKAKVTSKRQRGIASGRKKSIVAVVPHSTMIIDVYPPVRPLVVEASITPIETNDGVESNQTERQQQSQEVKDVKKIEPIPLENNISAVDILPVKETKPIQRSIVTKKPTVSKHNRPSNINVRATKIPVKRTSNILSPKTNKQKFELQPSKNIPSTSNQSSPSGDTTLSAQELDNQDSSERKTSTATIILQPIEIQSEEPVYKPDSPVSETKKTELLKNHQESSIEEDIFEDTEHFDSPTPPPTISIVPAQSSASYVNTLEINADEGQENVSLEPNQSYAIMKQPSQNLSELVMDTQKLIKQMRDEITSDIHSSASYVSDDDYTLRTEEYDDYEDDESGSFEWTDDDDEEGEETFGEEVEAEEEEIYSGPENEEDDGWTDVSTNYDSENEENLQEIKEILQEDLNNIERFNSIPREDQTDDSELIVNTETILDQTEPLEAASSETEPVRHDQNNISELIDNTETSPNQGEATETEPVVKLKQVETTKMEEEPYNELQTATIEEAEVILHEFEITDVIPPTRVTPIGAESVADETLLTPFVTEPSEATSSQNEAKRTIESPPKPNTVKKILVRKRSITNPIGIITPSNNIKNIQSKFLNSTPKSSATGTIPKQIGTTAAKVSSLKTPTAVSTKLPTSLKQSTPALSNVNLTTITPLNKSQMSDVIQNLNLPVTSSNGPTMSQQPEYREPKKVKSKIRYRETCFSDQYETSDDENDAGPQEKWTTKEFYKISKTIEDNEELLKEDHTVLVQKFIDEGKVNSICEGELVVSLLELKFDQESAIWASSQCKTIDEAIIILRKDCELCLENYSLNEFVQMLKCSHQCCKKCARNYFTVQITERAITDCTCPYCKIPELHDPNTPEDEVVEYFSNLDIILKNILSSDDHELFQRKLRDRALLQDPNFKWCVECSSGFVASSKHRVLECPDCKSRTCASCRKPWEEQHKGITCDKFSEWKQLNDPEIQNEGFKKHLQMHGLQCPNCKFQYSLARGGCMHFTCTQCKYEFCYGCSKPFKIGAKCTVSNYCAKLGLHAHHPRNCLYFLRDKEPHELQNLLRIHDISFETESLADQMQIEGANHPHTVIRCPIPLQKDTPAGLVDTVCNGDVLPNQAGLCRDHFVEYLCSRVRKCNIDPCPILDLNDCIRELKRHLIELPERGPWDTDPLYREMCLKIVKDQIPLN